VEAGLLPGDHEDAGTHHGPEGQPGQIPPREAAIHAVLAGAWEHQELVRVARPVQEPVLEARTRGGQGCAVGFPVLE